MSRPQFLLLLLDSPRFYSANHCYYWFYKDERILDIDKFQLPDHKRQSTEKLEKIASTTINLK